MSASPILAKDLIARRMSEAELQENVLELAKALGWRTAHFRPAKTAKGWRTAVQGDGAGFPDLILLRGSWGLAVELKAEKGRLSPAQVDWLDAFFAVGFVRCIWRPSDWVSGLIEEALK